MRLRDLGVIAEATLAERLSSWLPDLDIGNYPVRFYKQLPKILVKLHMDSHWKLAL